MTKKILTLCLVYQHPKILLGLKKRGFGQSKWNGFGGKVQAGETIEEAALRELREEAGIIGGDLVKVGINEFEFVGNPEILEVHIFQTDKFSGEPVESEEMKPKWFEIQDVPFAEMWVDDRHWFPMFLAGKRFHGKFLFEGTDKIINFELNEKEIV